MDPITQQTPVEIDTQLAALYYENLRLSIALGRSIDRLHYAAGDDRHYPFGRGSAEWKMTTDEALAKVQAKAETNERPWEYPQKALGAYAAAREAVQANIEDQKVFGAEFRRRGGWTRAFLVTNGDGHVHSSMNCSTCNRGQSPTSFQWMTNYSDHDEAEIVAAAGWRACTICYPSAPVGDEKSLPTKMFSEEDISKAEAKVIREQAKAERLAKKFAKAPTKSGEPLTVVTERGVNPSHVRNPGQPYERSETFQTERAAMIWAVQHQGLHLQGYYKIPHLVDKGELVTTAIEIIAQAIADKRGVPILTVLDEIEKKATAKNKRESRGY